MMFRLSGILLCLTMALAVGQVNRDSLLHGITILNFDKVSSYDHKEARAQARITFDSLAKVYSWKLVQTSSDSIITSENLEPFDVVMFNNNSGKLFDVEKQEQFKTWYLKKKGFVGIHSASHAFRSQDPKDSNNVGTGYWPWFEELVGKTHKSGPGSGNRGYPDSIIMLDTTARFNHFVPDRWVHNKVEWYLYRRELPDSVHLIARSHIMKKLKNFPEFYPVVWCQHFQGGRSWYTNMGHYGENFSEDIFFLQHVLDGIAFAADTSGTGCGRPEKQLVSLVPYKPGKHPVELNGAYNAAGRNREYLGDVYGPLFRD